MDKMLRNALVLGVLVTSFSIGYYLVIKPNTVQKTEFDACYEKCLESNSSQARSCVITCGRNYSN
jgi:hypothetical protein